MTPAKLQELARQAGLLLPHESACGTALTRFAALARVAVLEEAARECDPQIDGRVITHRLAATCATAIRALAQQAGGEQASRGTIPADRQHDAG